MTRGQKLVAGVIGGLVGLNVLVLAVDSTFGRPSGPASSSYTTAPDGLAAYADLVRDWGHAVTRLRGPLAQASLDPRATLVVLDPHRPLTRGDAVAVRSFVERGGRLIAGGTRDGGVIRRVLGRSPTRSREPVTNATTLAPAAGVEPGWSVVSAGGSWSDTGDALPVLGDDDAALAAVADVGRGTVFILADASPLQNALLGEADNAAFGLAAAGEERPVVFVESVHGYGEATGIRAIPTSSKWTLGGLLVAALALVLARGRRLGPPEREARELPPPRREYVDALAGVLHRTRRPVDATDPLRRAVRARVAASASLPPDASDEAVAETAARLGLRRDEIAAVFHPAPDGSDILAAGRALARLETRNRDRGGVR